MTNRSPQRSGTLSTFSGERESERMNKAKFDRAIMADAWKRYRDGQRLALGWTFGRCLATAWQAAKLRRTWDEQRAALAS